MDDGSIQNKGLHLNVYGFSSLASLALGAKVARLALARAKVEEVIYLKNTLENLFICRGGVIIKCSIHNHKKGYRLYIFEESMIIVRNHIHQYMHKDMLYKINQK